MNSIYWEAHFCSSMPDKRNENTDSEILALAVSDQTILFQQNKTEKQSAQKHHTVYKRLLLRTFTMSC